MEGAERRAAVALRAAERPDIRVLRSALARVERNFDEVLGLQDEEIARLRRLVLAATKAYRTLIGKSRAAPAANQRFREAMEAICLEADAITFSGDVAPKRRPSR